MKLSGKNKKGTHIKRWRAWDLILGEGKEHAKNNPGIGAGKYPKKHTNGEQKRRWLHGRQQKG